MILVILFFPISFYSSLSLASSLPPFIFLSLCVNVSLFMLFSHSPCPALSRPIQISTSPSILFEFFSFPLLISIILSFYRSLSFIFFSLSLSLSHPYLFCLFPSHSLFLYLPLALFLPPSFCPFPSLSDCCPQGRSVNVFISLNSSPSLSNSLSPYLFFAIPPWICFSCLIVHIPSPSLFMYLFIFLYTSLSLFISLSFVILFFSFYSALTLSICSSISFCSLFIPTSFLNSYLPPSPPAFLSSPLILSLPILSASHAQTLSRYASLSLSYRHIFVYLLFSLLPFSNSLSPSLSPNILSLLLILSISRSFRSFFSELFLNYSLSPLMLLFVCPFLEQNCRILTGPNPVSFP